VHGATVDEARAGQRTALALHGVERDQVARGDWLVAQGSLEPTRVLDVRFELLDDFPRAWPHHARVRFHLGASEIIGRLVLLEGTALEPGKSALAQLRLERPTVAARGDRYVIRAYSPARTVGGGVVIESKAARRRRLAPELEQLAVRETGSLEARLLQQVERETKPVATAAIARAVSEPEAAVAPALARLAEHGDVAAVGEGRWLAAARWRDARAAITRGVVSYTDAHPARFGIMKGELKSGLKSGLDATLFDLAFDALVRDATLEQRGERVRLAGSPWAPPADTLARLENVERELEANGLAVPEAATWQKSLGAEAAEVVALGLFLGRLARVSQEFTYTTRQLEDLRARLAKHFASKPTLTVADFKDVSGVSRKYAVPLLEHGDRSGWTVRVGDERRAGGKLAG
jgi:selenocysteine-specific elongation factor